MAARKLISKNNWLNDSKSMKIELSYREIEMLLTLISDLALGSNIIPDGVPLIYSTEELSLIRKLESALEKEINHKKNYPDYNSDVKH